MRWRKLAGVVVVFCLVLAAPGALGATGDTQTIDRIDDFEDQDTDIEQPHWALGWSNDVSLTSNAINDSYSGQITLSSSDDLGRAVRDVRSKQWLNFSTRMNGEQGETAVTNITIGKLFSPAVEIQYAENATDNYGNITVRDSSGTTKIGEWKEERQSVQVWELDWDFGANTVEIYLNGTSQGTFSTINNINGWTALTFRHRSQSGTFDDSNITFDDVGDPFSVTDPTVNNGTASPTGVVKGFQNTLSIEIDDPDFNTKQGDAITDVRWYRNGTQIGSTSSVNSKQTVSFTHTFPYGPSNWSVEVEDIYDGTTQSQNFTIRARPNLTIREESEPHEIVDNATVTIRVFGSNQTVDERSTTDGNISLAGLPTDETYVIGIEANGYKQRSAIISDLTEQKDLFVPNASQTTTVETTFSINDRTGDFASPTLIIEKPINRSIYNPSASPGGYQYAEIAGDRIGAADFTATLIKDDRYRLLVRNSDGDTRVLGGYTAETTRPVELTIESVGINQLQSQGAIQYNVTKSNGKVIGTYNDTEGKTDPLTVVIYEKNNASNEIFNDTFNNANGFGEVRISETLTSAQQNKSWVVEFRADRDGETEVITVPLGAGQDRLIPGVPFPYLEIGAIGLIITTPALMAGNRAETGAVVAAILATVMWYIDALPDMVNIATVGFALLVAVMFKLRDRGGVEVQ